MNTYKGYTIEKAISPEPGYDGCYEHDIYSHDGVWQGMAYSFSEACWRIDNGLMLDQY